MINRTQTIASAAKDLSRSPLGIIALFILLAYGFASMVLAFGEDLGPTERMPIIYFLVFFPVLVLGAFVWLVVAHSAKLFGPGDFKNEDNFVKLAVAASLGAATARHSSNGLDENVAEIAQVVDASEPVRESKSEEWRTHVLWVDDRPENNVYERKAFERMGLKFTLALSTSQALELLSQKRFGVIISDMGRKEGPREGYVLLDTIRRKGDKTPLIFYAASNLPEHKVETAAHGGQGCTNRPRELFELVLEQLTRQ